MRSHMEKIRGLDGRKDGRNARKGWKRRTAGKRRKVESAENDPRYRVNIFPGVRVKIVEKQHQRTGELTEGTVQQILTNSSVHPRGIKVRLTSGIVGRVTKILEA